MADREHFLRQEVTRLEDEVRELSRELTQLRHFIRALQSVSDAVDTRRGLENTMELLEGILRNALDAIGAEDGSLLILDEDTRELVFVLALGDVPSDRFAGMRLPAGTGIAGWVAERREATVVDDVHNDPRFYPKVDEAMRFQTRSILAAPITGAGRVLGVIEVLNKDLGRGFTADDLSLLTLLCRFAGELLESLEASAREQGKPPMGQDPDADPGPEGS